MSEANAPKHLKAGSVEGLVDKLEAAEGGSRWLDAEVYAAVTDGDWTAGKDGWIENEARAMATTTVTTSLDAALALAERVLPKPDSHDQERAEIRLTIHDTGAQVFIDLDTFGGLNLHFGYAPTPALALCIAILKSRLSLTLEGEGGALRPSASVPGGDAE